MGEELGYLGDGVYLSFDGFQYWLAVGDHHNKVVAMEPAVIVAFNTKLLEHRKKLTDS